MADQSGLRVIGFSFGAVAAAVSFIAAVLVVNVDRTVEAPSRPAIAAFDAR